MEVMCRTRYSDTINQIHWISYLSICTFILTYKIWHFCCACEQQNRDTVHPRDVYTKSLICSIYAERDHDFCTRGKCNFACDSRGWLRSALILQPNASVSWSRTNLQKSRIPLQKTLEKKEGLAPVQTRIRYHFCNWKGTPDFQGIISKQEANSLSELTWQPLFQQIPKRRSDGSILPNSHEYYATQSINVVTKTMFKWKLHK